MPILTKINKIYCQERVDSFKQHKIITKKYKIAI